MIWTVLLIAMMGCQSLATPDKIQLTASDMDINNNQKDTALLGNGCFWCTEAVFQQLKGVDKVTSGYSGGFIPNPTYEQVCTGTTGHAECLEIVYDPSVISYTELLEVFWNTHDPTTLNRQGNDVGPQYRSVVFYKNETEKQLAKEYIQQLNASGVYPNPVVTTLEKLEVFYPAEAYHQNYYRQNGSQPYCRYVVRPKVEKFKKQYKDKLKD